MLPLASELLQRGTAVVLAANSRPSINDITADELHAVVQRAAAADAILGRAVDEQMLTVIPSGNDLPVIDLRKVALLQWRLCMFEREACSEVPLQGGSYRMCREQIFKLAIHPLRLQHCSMSSVADLTALSCLLHGSCH